MKKITKTKTIDIYVSDDGMVFSDENQCMKWEQDREDYRILENLYSMELSVPILTNEGFLYSQWFLIQNQSEKDAIIRKRCDYGQYCYINGQSLGKKDDILLGDWVVFVQNIEDEKGGVYTLSFIIENFKKFIEKASTLTVDGRY